MWNILKYNKTGETNVRGIWDIVLGENGWSSSCQWWKKEYVYRELRVLEGHIMKQLGQRGEMRGKHCREQQRLHKLLHIVKGWKLTNTQGWRDLSRIEWTGGPQQISQATDEAEIL